MALVRKPKSITMSDISLLPNLYVILFTTEHLNFYSPWNNHFSASVYSFHGKQILAEIGFQMSCCVIWEQTWFFWWSSYIYRYLLTKLSRCITIQLFTKLQPYCPLFLSQLYQWLKMTTLQHCMGRPKPRHKNVELSITSTTRWTFTTVQ